MNIQIRRWTKRLFVATFLLGGFLILLLLAVYFSLRSPQFNAYILRQAKPILAEQGVDLNFKSAKIDVLSGIKIDELVLNYLSADKSKVNLKLKKIYIEYGLGGLFRKKLKVESIHITGLQLGGDLGVNTDEEPSEEPVDEQGPPFDLAQFLENPPIEIEVGQVLVDDISVNLEVQAGQSRHKILLPSFLLDMKASLKKQELLFKLLLNVASQEAPLSFQTETTNSPQKSALSILQFLKTNVEFSLKSITTTTETSKSGADRETSKQVAFELNPIAIEWAARDLVMTAEDLEQKLLSIIKIPKLHFTSNWLMSGKVPDLSAAEPMANIFPVHIKGDKKFTIPKIEVYSQAADLKQDLLSSLELNGDIDFTLNSLEDMQQNTIRAFALDVNLPNTEVKQFQAAKLVQKISNELLELKVRGSKTEVYNFDIDVLLAGLQMPSLLQKKLQVSLLQNIALQPDFRQLTLQQNLSLNQKKMMSLNHVIHDEPKSLQVEQNIDFNVDRSLEAIIKNLKVFTQLGDWSGVLKLSTKVPHSQASFLAVDFSKLSEHAIKSLLQLQLQQTRRPVKVAGAPGVLLDLDKPLNLNADLALIQQKPLVELQLQMPALNALVYKVRDLKLDLNLAAQEQDDFKLNLAAKIKEVFLPELGQALSFALDNEVVFKENLSQIDLTSNAELNAQKLLKLHLNFNDAPKQADIRSQLEMQISPQLIASIKKINPLDLLGGIKLSKDMNVKIVHQSDSLKSLGPDPLAQIGLASNMRLVLAQTAVPKKSAPQRLILEEPLEIEHEASLRGNKLNSQLHLKLAKIEFMPVIAVDGVKLDLKTRSNDMTTLALLDNELALNVAQVHLLSPPTPAQESQEKQPPKIDISQFIKNIQLAVKLALQNKQRLNLEHLALKVDELLRFGAKGWLESTSQSGQISGFVDVAAPKNLAPIMKGKASGSIKVPWNLAIDKGKRFELDGQLIFKELMLVATEPALKVEGLSGSIPFREEIQLEDDKSLRFVYLVQQNPFERVDFQRQAPLLSSSPLYFKNIEAAGQQLGPFRGNIELEQNMLRLNRFDLDVLQGSISGELMLDLLPQQLSVRLLSRVTNIKPKLLGNTTSHEKLAPISLRTALVYDVNRALIDGRVDVDKIGGDQLISLINVLDPEYQDDQLNSARSALNLAYPTYVGINMQQGLMDMDIDLSLAGVPQSIQVRKIPLYSFVAAATGDLMQTLKGVPIQ